MSDQRGSSPLDTELSIPGWENGLWQGVGPESLGQRGLGLVSSGDRAGVFMNGLPGRVIKN